MHGSFSVAKSVLCAQCDHNAYTCKTPSNIHHLAHSFPKATIVVAVDAPAFMYAF